MKPLHLAVVQAMMQLHGQAAQAAAAALHPLGRSLLLRGIMFFK